MQSLIRSKSAGVTGGRGTAGAGPGRDLLWNNRHSVPTHIPIPGPTLSVAGWGGGSNTTHALLSPDPETLPMGGRSRPATGEFLETKALQGQPTVAPNAPLTAGFNSPSEPEIWLRHYPLGVGS